MEFKTEDQLKSEYGFCSVSLRVCGNFGDMESTCHDEEGAVRQYEDPRRWQFSGNAARLLRRGRKPKAAGIIIRATDWDGHPFYFRGWIDEKKWKWAEGKESLRIERLTEAP